MANFDVNQTDLTDAITFLEQFLTTNLPQFDFSEGTANRDIAINAIAYTTAFLRKEITNVKNRQSLLKLTEISEDDSADEVADEILSDWFLSRKTGDKSTGFVTLEFTRQDIGVVIFSQLDLFVRSGKNFIIKNESETVQASNLAKNTDNLGIEFFTTSIQLQSSEAGEESDIDPGPFSEFPQVSPFLKAVRNLSKFTGGKSKETTDEMVTRSEDAITQRTLNTDPSIKTVLTQEFAQVQEVSPTGMGDAEMIRDIILVPRGTGNTELVHRGSKIDAYIKFPINFEIVYSEAFPDSGGIEAISYTVNEVAITAIKLPDFPLYKIRSLLDRSSDPAVEVAYSVVVEDIALWGSSRQGIYLAVDISFLGAFLDIVYDTVEGYSAVSDFVEDRTNRIIVADVLAKASFSLYLSFEIRYYPTTETFDVDSAKTQLQEFVHGRVLGTNFKVSEISTQFVTLFPGNVVQLPFVVVGELLLPNGKILNMTFTDVIDTPVKYYFDELTPDDLTPLFEGDPDPAGKTIVVLSDIQVSTRTMRYVVSTSDIEITTVS